MRLNKWWKNNHFSAVFPQTDAYEVAVQGWMFSLAIIITSDAPMMNGVKSLSFSHILTAAVSPAKPNTLSPPTIPCNSAASSMFGPALTGSPVEFHIWDYIASKSLSSYFLLILVLEMSYILDYYFVPLL